MTHFVPIFQLLLCLPTLYDDQLFTLFFSVVQTLLIYYVAGQHVAQTEFFSSTAQQVLTLTHRKRLQLINLK